SLGWVYFKKGQIKKAIRELEKAAELIPEDPTIAEHLGDAYLESAMIDKAKVQYEKALRTNPEKKELQDKLKKIEQLQKKKESQ
ncbi:MAG: tetratricopeptide repeat protein, partial [Proteobacteria bacterium]|nr:tetratricopeptide repeat protein [Pseudomonadota bacterium]